MSDVQNTAMAGDSQFSHALQDDGREHRSDALAYLCLTLGVIALVLAIAEKWSIATAAHYVGAAVGLVGFALSVYAQMTSSSTRERWIIVPGWVLAGTFGALNFYFTIN
jgi:hypothetical protein